MIVVSVTCGVLTKAVRHNKIVTGNRKTVVPCGSEGNSVGNRMLRSYLYRLAFGVTDSDTFLLSQLHSLLVILLQTIGFYVCNKNACIFLVGGISCRL